MKTYKAIIVPTVAGGNIEVRISANSTSQAIGLIKTLPYFKSFAKQPTQEGNKDNHLTELSDLIKKANAKKQTYILADSRELTRINTITPSKILNSVNSINNAGYEIRSIRNNALNVLKGY